MGMSPTIPALTTMATATAMAMALATVLLGLLLPLVSAAAITTRDTTKRAHTLDLLPSRRLSPHAGTDDAEDGDAPVIVVVTTTVAIEHTTADTVPDALAANATTAFATPSHSCDLMYCDNGTSYCIYWGGYSSYDYTEHHPIPGETRTAIGTCRGLATAANPNSTSTSTGGSPVVSTSIVGADRL